MTCDVRDTLYIVPEALFRAFLQASVASHDTPICTLEAYIYMTQYSTGLLQTLMGVLSVNGPYASVRALRLL